jgi:hypothetical protein
MADNAIDRPEGSANCAFKRIDLMVHFIDAERRIDAAMIIDDEPG